MRSSLLSMTGLAVLLAASACLVGCGPAPHDILDPSVVYLDARAKLLQEAQSGTPVARMQAIEAIAETLAHREGAVFAEAIKDPSPGIRFAAAMAIGDIKYAPARDHLIRMAADKRVEPNKLVFCAVIYSLFQFGNTDYTRELGTLLFDPEKEVRATAAMAMGRIGELSALVPLKRQYSQEQDPTVRLRLVEAMTMLGDDRSASLLEAYTKSQFMDERLDAIRAMESAPAERAAFALRNMLKDRQPPFVRVAAAGALAAHGEVNEDNFLLCMTAVVQPERMLAESREGPETPNGAQIDSLRQLGARSLGIMNLDPALPALEPLLDDPSGGVRIAAAMSILKILDAYHEELTPSVEAPGPVEAAQPERAGGKDLYSAGGKD